MAYWNTLFALPPENIAAFQADFSKPLIPTRHVKCSHLLASYDGETWGGALREVLDGGKILHPQLNHPFFDPKLHDAAAVATLAPVLRLAWESETEHEAFYGPQILSIVELFEWAGENGEVVVSVIGDLGQGGELRLVRDAPPKNHVKIHTLIKYFLKQRTRKN